MTHYGDQKEPTMDAAHLLWVDSRVRPLDRRLYKSLRSRTKTTRINQYNDVPRTIQQIRPNAACIEFDYPNEHLLCVIPTLTRLFPALPILMLTEYHSEELAVWAFRCGVWDYRVKPLTDGTFERLIDALMMDSRSQPSGFFRCNSVPRHVINAPAHLPQLPSVARKTGAAVTYIATHFGQSVTRDVLARLCHLSQSQFTRRFRDEHGTTFEHFLLEYRIAKARNYLAQASITVSQAAYNTGFDDPSYFSRVFKQLSGFTPSEYQKLIHASHTLSDPGANGDRS